MNIKGYLDDVAKEMRKVTWPPRNELISNTVLTLVATLAIASFIWLADRAINLVLEVIYG